jgi:predicted transcriptional regulator
MQMIELGEVQAKFADIVWAHAPIPSGTLAKICERELNWKRPTTYTVLRKLCEKGLFTNTDGLVQVKITREQFYSSMSEQFVEESFSGSLPAFIAAFTAKKPLTNAEADEIMRMIASYRKERES